MKPAGKFIARHGLALGLSLIWSTEGVAAATELMPETPAITVALPETGHAKGLLTLPLTPTDTVPPLPVAVLLPDVDGFGPRTQVYGGRLLENGWAVLEAVPNTGDGGDLDEQVLPPSGAHLTKMLAVLADDARVNVDRGTVIGLGQGARTALQGWAEGSPVGTVVLLYPGCDTSLTGIARDARPAVRGARVLILHGDADAANLPGSCEAMRRAFPPSVEVHRIELRGATYGWDALLHVRPGGAILWPHPDGQGGRVLAHPNATTALIAADRVLTFILTARH